MKRVGTQELFSYAVFFLCLSVVLFARAEEWWEAPDWRPTPNDEEAFVQDYPGEHQFLAACRQGRVDVMEYWLSQKGFRPNDEFISGCKGDRVSGLWVASQKGHTAGVKLLIKAGADLNQAGDEATPLYMASQNGHAEVVEILVKAEADLNQSTNDGATPLFMASQNGHAEVVEILVKAGADLNRTWNGVTPLFKASQNGHAEVVEILVKAEADLNQSTNDGATPLFMASQGGHAEAVEILIKAGADPTREWHLIPFFTKSPLTAAKYGQPSWRKTNPKKYDRYDKVVKIVNPAVKAWKEQKKIQAQIDGNTGCFDGFVDALKHEIKHTVAPLMTRVPLKNKGY